MNTTPAHENKVRGLSVDGHEWISRTDHEAILQKTLDTHTHCQKTIEGDALCGCKLDCHLHDWRADKEEITPAHEWRSELWDLLYEEYGDVGQNGNIRDFIQKTLDTERARLVERIENLKDNQPNYKTHKDNILDQVITILRK